MLPVENGVALIFGNESFVCHGAQCSYISGWQSITSLTHATYMKASNAQQFFCPNSQASQ